MMRALVLVVFAATIPLAAIGTAYALSVEQVVKVAKPATVLIVVATNSGAQSGTGFAVQSSADSTTIVTANHVVEGETQVDVIFDSSEKERYPAEVVRRDHVKDVAILKVHVGHRPTLSLESPEDVAEGMQIVLIGYPLATIEFFHRVEGDALRPSVHTGIVSAIRFKGAVLQFDAATYHGDSGGPIIDTDNGRVVSIVHGAALDPSYAAQGLEQSLPGSSFGPSSSTIASVMFGTGSSTVAAVSNQDEESSSNAPALGVAAAGTSSSFRVGYGIPHETVSGDPQSGNEINQAIESAALNRLQGLLKQDNALYLIPVSLEPSVVSDPQRLSGYCDDARLNALVFPAYSWALTGGPRYNAFGGVVGYSGEATATVNLFVVDCYGTPFFLEQKSKSENRYFAHRAPDRELVDMTNDLLSQLMSDFDGRRTKYAATWQSLLKTGLNVDPTDGKLHTMMFFVKKPEGYQVMSVVPNGPADHAGIKAQDIIEQINGQDASTMDGSQLVDLMNAPSYALVLQRPGGNVAVTVHPQTYDDLLKELQH
jgi:S1-C subfamily serine protease